MWPSLSHSQIEYSSFESEREQEKGQATGVATVIALVGTIATPLVREDACVCVTMSVYVLGALIFSSLSWCFKT